MKSDKKSKPIGKIILSIFLVIAIGIGVFGTVVGIKEAVKNKRYEDAINKNTTEKIKLSKESKEFSCEKFSITLTEDFEIFEDSAIEIGCVAKGIEVYVIGDTFEAGSDEAEMTAKEYIESLADDSEGNIKVDEFEGVPFVEYVYRGENDEVVKNYKVFCYRGEDCFWMVHFITESDYNFFYKPYVFEWVKTIEAK